MSRSTEEALGDAASTALRDRIDAVQVISGVWPYADPGRLVADRIGAATARTCVATMGGNQVYDLVTDTALRIQRGDLDVAVLCGAETLRTRRSDRARGRLTQYLSEREGAAPDEVFGTDKPFTSDAEQAVGLGIVARFYAMAETALRHRSGEGLTEHRERIAALWARASAVAAANPNVWSRRAVSAQEIATESASNRPVASPYLKLMTSNLNVDQGGAIVMTSVASAQAAGVPRDRWIFPWAGVGAADHWYPTNRWAFDESPAMRFSGRRTLELAGSSVDDCDLIDLYSCFPVAVQVAQRELGVDPARAFTITGGLTFAAGPLNCYCLLPLTRAVALLRESSDRRALLTGNGGSFTKHSTLVLAAEPSGNGFLTDDVQSAVDALPSRPTPTVRAGEVTLETYTVTFDREMRPELAIMAGLDADGTRHWANSTDPVTIAELSTGDHCGRALHLDGEIGVLA